MLRINESRPRDFALTLTEHRRLRETYCRIGEACTRQPRSFTDNRNPRSVHRAYLATMPQYLRAVETAGTRDAQRDAVELACAHLDEMKAILRARVEPVTLSLCEARRLAQAADSAEDIAQERYATEPTPTNGEAWGAAIIEAHETDSRLLTCLRRVFS